MARPAPFSQDAELRAIFRHSMTERLSCRLAEGGGAFLEWLRYTWRRSGAASEQIPIDLAQSDQA